LQEGVQKPCFCIFYESTAFALLWPTQNDKLKPDGRFRLRKRDSSIAVVSDLTPMGEGRNKDKES
jgi:hypothetical protein